MVIERWGIVFPTLTYYRLVRNDYYDVVEESKLLAWARIRYLVNVRAHPVAKLTAIRLFHAILC